MARRWASFLGGSLTHRHLHQLPIPALLTRRPLLAGKWSSHSTNYRASTSSPHCPLPLRCPVTTTGYFGKPTEFPRQRVVSGEPGVKLERLIVLLGVCGVGPPCPPVVREFGQGGERERGMKAPKHPKAEGYHGPASCTCLQGNRDFLRER
ncbi:hypothetical protein NDU88_004276 [Pleurodeles waltl]|uniref:Uncharacterized protein n=1 Tax=Pleurodeles waltl TaxID=8319 RepID=A0AAV7V0Y4_PLEWA|nr:hypothetical protein NDU88_004276 [Pleurodeles waltl]